MDNGVNDKGDGVTDDDDDNSVGATDDNVDEDGDGNGATDEDGDSNGVVDDNDDFDDKGHDDSNGAADDNKDNIDNVNDNNLPLCVGKRNDGCDETKMEEEETVADSVVIHTTIKQITGRGGGRW